MALFGDVVLALVLGLLVYATVVGGYAALSGRGRLVDSAGNALVASFAGTALATGALVLAFVRNDFSLTYVAGHSSRELPLGYTLAALWSGQEGSLLLWLLVLTGMSTVALLLNRRLVREVLPWTVPVLAGIAAFFALIPNVVASPFGTQPAPLNGVGMNASLQNPYMMIHPPVLYLGYVSLAIPFAFAMAALLSRRVDERWIVASRRWTLFSWTFLGIAILIGAKWAYESIGWGGYYAWDPVENAALMPWLAATAFLHSVMVQEKKNMLRVWNVVLIALTFSLTLFGTFLTRSGAINSIHSFSQSSIGGWFLALIVVVASGSALLILTRLDDLRTPTRFESLASREAAFLYNNLLLVAFALTMLWGVAFPLLSEALRGEAVTVGPPYYNFFLKVFGLPLLLLMGLGPLLAWRRASLRSVARAAAGPFLLAGVVGALLLAAGAGSSPPGLIAYTFAMFVTGAIVLEFWRGRRRRPRSSVAACTGTRVRAMRATWVSSSPARAATAGGGSVDTTTGAVQRAPSRRRTPRTRPSCSSASTSACVTTRTPAWWARSRSPSTSVCQPPSR